MRHHVQAATTDESVHAWPFLSTFPCSPQNCSELQSCRCYNDFPKYFHFSLGHEHVHLRMLKTLWWKLFFVKSVAAFVFFVSFDNKGGQVMQSDSGLHSWKERKERVDNHSQSIVSRKFMLIPPHKYRYNTLGGEFICYMVIAFGKHLMANFSGLDYVKLFIVTSLNVLCLLI